MNFLNGQSGLWKMFHVHTSLWTIGIWTSSRQLIQHHLIGRRKGESAMTWTKVLKEFRKHLTINTPPDVAKVIKCL